MITDIIRPSIMLLFLAACGYMDMKKKVIPNVLTFTGMAVGLLMSWYCYGLKEGLGFSALSALIVFIVLIIPYHYGHIGAGDIKMIMLMAAFTGIAYTTEAIIVSSLLSGIVGIIILIRKRNFRYMLPFGIFIAVGTAIYQVITWVMM